MTKTEHQRFVQSVRYSPNGDHFATGGFDGKIFIYDGKTSDLIGELGLKIQKINNISRPIDLFFFQEAQLIKVECTPYRGAQIARAC